MPTATLTGARHRAADVCLQAFAFPFGPPSPNTPFLTGARFSF